MTDRVQSRIARIELVLDDQEKAKEVAAVYESLEDALLAYKRIHAQSVSALLALDGTSAQVERDMNDIVRMTRRADAKLRNFYIAQQLKLRQLLTEEEFNRIDALR